MCDIALGMQDAGLIEFAGQVNASYMSQWKDLGLYDDDVEGWGEAFHQAIERTLDRGGRMHFNLTGLAIDEALAGDPNYWVDRHTAWELQMIVRKELWLEQTTFYLDGKRLEAPEVANLGIVFQLEVDE